MPTVPNFDDLEYAVQHLKLNLNSGLPDLKCPDCDNNLSGRSCRKVMARLATRLERLRRKWTTKTKCPN